MFPFFLSFYFISEYGGGSVTKSCPTLCESMDCSPPGSTVHVILQARILEWVVMPPLGDLPNPGIEPRSLLHHRWILYHLSHQGYI